MPRTKSEAKIKGVKVGESNHKQIVKEVKNTKDEEYAAKRNMRIKLKRALKE